MSAGLSLEHYPLHLGQGASAMPQPAFTGAMDWYMAYASRTEGDGAEGRLVTMHSFTEDWTSWEMHPVGAEVLLCVAGEMTVIQEHPEGQVERVTLAAGDYAINPQGVWHTADIVDSATAVFITCGLGTENRPRHLVAG